MDEMTETRFEAADKVRNFRKRVGRFVYFNKQSE